jgi:hypothetical protein
MRMFVRIALLIPLALGAVHPGIGQTPDSAQAAPPPVTIRPPYRNLRFEEDYRFLANAQGLAPSLFDPIKYIPLGRRAWLQAGGEFWLRYEEETNKFLAPDPQPADGFTATRMALHLDLHLAGWGRIFAEGIHGEVYDRDQLLFFIHRNRLDLHQLFADFELTSSAAVRVGRQEFAFGRERLISAAGWGRMRRRFDAVTLLARDAVWELQAWYGRPVIIETAAPDRPNREVDFAGAYLKGRTTGLDLYYYYKRDRRDLPNANGGVGDRTMHTFGAALARTRGPLDVDLEVAAQPMGHWAGDAVRAWSLGAQGGYTATASKRLPRLGLGVEVSSGDDDPRDNAVNTFDHLFRQERTHLGYLVMYGRQNLEAYQVNARIALIPRKATFEVFHYWFRLQSGTDALYNPGGFSFEGRRDAAGGSGRSLGRELDLGLTVQVGLHHTFMLGYEWYWNGSFIDRTGAVTRPADGFVQYRLRF